MTPEIVKTAPYLQLKFFSSVENEAESIRFFPEEIDSWRYLKGIYRTNDVVKRPGEERERERAGKGREII